MIIKIVINLKAITSFISVITIIIITINYLIATLKYIKVLIYLNIPIEVTGSFHEYYLDNYLNIHFIENCTNFIITTIIIIVIIITAQVTNERAFIIVK
jgi:hypothetical protein